MSGTTGAMMNDQGVTEADRSLNSQIRSAFNADSSLRASASSVNLSSDDGVVTLNGTVATEKEKTDLENRLERMTGVKRVENKLQISPRTSSVNPSGTTATR
jgi:osmotically-inducible protein OsmY